MDQNILTPPLLNDELRYIDKGRFYIMGGIIGHVLCVHDITIRVVIILITYIYIGHNLLVQIYFAMVKSVLLYW